MINNIIFEIMCQKAENERVTIKQRQAEGIAVAKSNNVRFGRPKTIIPNNFSDVYKEWKSGNITAKKAMELTGLKRTNFYKIAKEYTSNTSNQLQVLTYVNDK